VTTPVWRVAFAAALVAVVGCRAVSPDRELLRRSWEGYRARFVAADGRVVRPEHGGDTVSEGQAYTLLRAAWMDDQPTFDRVWRWTRTHLTRTDREGGVLLAWRWSAEDGGHVIDWNAATDADADVALALLMAADRWPAPSDAGLPGYAGSARAILKDLADHALATDDRQLLFLLPGSWADQRAQGRGLVLNPSYLAPASYRLFYQATADERWLSLASSAYDVLDTVCSSPVASAGAVPDWVRWWSADHWSPEGAADGRSSWDAVRVPWRVASDLIWFNEARARRFLSRCLEPFVRQHLEAGQGLAVERSLTGAVLGADDHPLANAMFAFALSEPRARDRLLARLEGQLIAGSDGLFFGDADHYYVNSLAYLPYLARAGRYVPPGRSGR
jgi:endoglucanase